MSKKSGMSSPVRVLGLSVEIPLEGERLENLVSDAIDTGSITGRQLAEDETIRERIVEVFPEELGNTFREQVMGAIE